MNKLTVKEILQCKGNKKLTEVYTHNSLEAESCELAGIEMIISSERNDIEGIRNAAKNTFLTVGLQYGKYLNELEILHRCFYLYKKGADAIYCPQSYKFIKSISDEGIPVVGHTGFIPYKSTFYGGFKAYGKTANEASIIYDQTLRLQDAGAFAIEIEIVPSKVAEYISKNVDVFIIGMGSGQGCDAQYLFSEDILGYNKGHIPRHAKVYSDLSEDYKKIKTKAINAYKNFKEEVILKKYPEKKHDIDIPDNEYSDFLKK
ncbi:MAG: 3-methyl-2-oxobutanoate hydroxymethyltransferase [Alphaproteobacteria bacterium MarineAlpha5_Bin12]|nr:3-methyl-2-oxobutanoate hydroxymethyltransferase [Pelagibacteraceae bacterium]PPR41100.1 MAG: 3-methyl-2-oxobutanoate hydroxymethyltransferase [Alphaproteobacteria bacterium MarineAlpha5_Bin12]|tara:strand:- start:30180 stop:30959 length:780 start_codon:yes stop_codon:yes gene_type:complete